MTDGLLTDEDVFLGRYVPAVNSTFANDSYQSWFNVCQNAPEIEGAIQDLCCGTGSAPEFPYHLPVTTLAVATFIYIIIFIFGILGNSLLCFVIWKTSDMRSSTYVLLGNLGVADLLVLVFSMPSKLLEIYRNLPWMLGRAMCVIVGSMETISTQTSVLTMLVIASERYCAICHPLKVQYVCTVSRTVKVIVCVWLFAILTTIPYMVHSSIQIYWEPINGYCYDECKNTLPDMSNLSLQILFFFIPLILLIAMYSAIARQLLNDKYTQEAVSSENRAKNMKTRRQVIGMLAAVTTIFFVCWLPRRIINLLLVYKRDALIWLDYNGYHHLEMVCNILVYINSAINPILYNMISSKFRAAFMTAMGCRQKRRFRRSGSTVTSYTSVTTYKTNSNQSMNPGARTPNWRHDSGNHNLNVASSYA